MSQEADMEDAAKDIATMIVNYFHDLEDCKIDWSKARKDMERLYLDYTRPLIEEP